MTTRQPVFPERYEPVAPLGRGGGGEVWSVRDRATGELCALKMLPADAEEAQVLALVREAVALSGLEGLDVPRVRSFGRLPTSGRAYLVRELVEGESLLDSIATPAGAKRALGAMVEASEAVTVLHRAGLLHGDIKPANIIVGPTRTTLVDLGLAASYREKASQPLGLTPRYAAPELLVGRPLTVRAEVFALGATLRQVAEAARAALDPATWSALDEVIARATSDDPDARFPSADELASTLERTLSAAGLTARRGEKGEVSHRAWPIVGIDGPAHELTTLVEGLRDGGGVVITGPRLSGRTTLMRRVAWTLGARGRAVAHVEARVVSDPRMALEMELGSEARGVVALIDDLEALDAASLERISDFRARGGRLVITTLAPEDAQASTATLAGSTLQAFALWPLEEVVARELVLRAIPSLGPALADHVTHLAERWPGRLRAIVGVLATAPVVAPEDVDRLVAPVLVSKSVRRGPPALGALRSALDRGHFEEAAELLEAFEADRSLPLVIARARLLTNRGESRRALAMLGEASDEATASTGIDPAEWWLHTARAHLRAGDYPAAERHANEVADRLGDSASSQAGRALVAEAVSIAGLAQSLSSEGDAALTSLRKAVELARALGEPRLLSVTLGSLAFALQRNDELVLAAAAYEESLGEAERAGDAGSVATTRLNLATIAKTQGDLALALSHLEAAVDMGRRSGRITTLMHALLNLANLDLYIGRLAKAQVSIDALAAERDDLPRHLGAQLFALEAEAAGKAGDATGARALCQRCADAYVSLGRTVDAAEAHLEGMLFSLSLPSPDLAALRRELADVEKTLDGTGAHRALSLVVAGRIEQCDGKLTEAKAFLERAIESARTAGLRDWEWRALELRSEVALETGQTLAARRDRESALGILEEIAAKLPRDLREVYWNDPERRSLRTSSLLPETLHDRPVAASPAPLTAPTDRLARLLEINREIAGTYDLKRLLERVTDHAIALSSAERGFVILKSRRPEADAGLSVHASRGEGGDDPHARFSQSIADRVIATGEAVVTTSARDDARMADYVSVHALMLQSVACVPIRSRSAGVIGALYLETRLKPAVRFGDEVGLLAALADQVAIAIETARLVSENETRTEELARTNLELARAREKLEELLDHRTAQLTATRRDLRSARAVLKGHFGYEGLVGTSEAMRRVYALVDRIKDTDVPVLIVGESGTGKEIIAQAIHNAGARAKKPFVGINCAAIPEHLLESELFGHVRGAFTGAERDRRGLFREASEGTILLDEVGEMPVKMQPGLLRVLQEKVVRPVGGSREEPVDTRVIAATHRDLAAMVEAGTFREDLFYRLNVILVRVPPLRERLDDIPILIDHFLGIFAARYGRERRSVSRAALKILMAQRWPGNVRQLENVLLNAWVLSDAPELEQEDFETLDAGSSRTLGKPSSVAVAPAKPSSANLPTSLDQHRNDEREGILAALTSSNWNRVKAAELLGMPRRTFYRRLKEYGIQ